MIVKGGGWFFDMGEKGYGSKAGGPSAVAAAMARREAQCQDTDRVVIVASLPTASRRHSRMPFCATGAGVGGVQPSQAMSNLVKADSLIGPTESEWIRVNQGAEINVVESGM